MSRAGGATGRAESTASFARRMGSAAAMLVALLAVACGQRASEAPPVPMPDMADMETQVAQRLRETRAAVLADPGSAEAWGRFGMVNHAHELWAEAQAAYQEAWRLDPQDERWPYYLGDVLSVVGTDPQAAAEALRRALSLRGDYAPAHMRLGKVLLAAGEDARAAAELARALELEPDLQPARLALAQIRLSQGDLELSAAMLEQILDREPRHAQALSTLGQAYMRQGRRDEARQIAERARTAALYNLYSDPLMSRVVAEGVSVVLLWERAKAFFDNGNYEQASRGLRQVVALQPSNADAHHQLATAYGNLGELDGARRHLERTVTLRPDGVAARIQLATVHLDQGHPAAAVAHLHRLQELAPEDPDVGWLLARAMVEAGDLAGGLEEFEATAGLGFEAPGWAHDEWGRALAQSGRPQEALAHFRTALAQDPEDAQALFYTGLVFEGQGRIEEAVEHYCRSMKAAPNPPSATRLQALERVCG